MGQPNSIEREFVAQATFRMEENLRMVTTCLDCIPGDLIWKKPNVVSNSVGNLILHLCGNIAQYAIASLKGSSDQRDRDREFAAKSGFTKKELLDMLQKTVHGAIDTFKTIESGEFLRKRKVQGFELSGIGNMVHVVEHFSYYTGQIALWTKPLDKKSLGFWEGIDLNRKNEQ